MKLSRTPKGNAKLSLTPRELEAMQAYLDLKRSEDTSRWKENAVDEFRRLQLPEQLPPCLKPEQYAKPETEARRRARAMARAEAMPGWPPQ